MCTFFHKLLTLLCVAVLGQSSHPYLVGLNVCLCVNSIALVHNRRHRYAVESNPELHGCMLACFQNLRQNKITFGPWYWGRGSDLRWRWRIRAPPVFGVIKPLNTGSSYSFSPRFRYNLFHKFSIQESVNIRIDVWINPLTYRLCFMGVYIFVCISVCLFACFCRVQK